MNRLPTSVCAPQFPCRKPGLDIVERTGPLDLIEGKRVLLLADDENLRLSARDLGFKVSHQCLGELLRQHTRTCTLHTYFSRDPGDDRRSDYFRERGWIPHPRNIEYRAQPDKPNLPYKDRQRIGSANSDNNIAFGAGVLVSRTHAEVVVLASGDGNLVCDIALELHTLPTPRQLVTLSLAGSTSQRLDARSNRAIDGNIELGLDCLRPIVPTRRTHVAVGELSPRKFVR